MATPAPPQTRQCVACGRTMMWDANVCPYCGKDYRQQAYGPQPMMQQTAPVPKVSKGSGAGAAVGIIGSILVLVGIFLPWASAGAFGFSISFSGWDMNSLSSTWGGGSIWQVIGLLAIGLICIVFAIMEAIAAKVSGALVLVFGIISTLIAFSALNEISPVSSIPGASIGIGIWICIIGSIIVAIGGLIGVLHQASQPMPAMPMQQYR